MATLITVRARYTDSQGAPGSGYVSFTERSVLADPGGDRIIENGTIRVPLDNTGSFSIALPATDSGVLPLNSTYLVVEQISGATRSYDIPIPTASPGGVLDLVTAAPFPAATGNLLASYTAVQTALAAIPTVNSAGRQLQRPRTVPPVMTSPPAIGAPQASPTINPQVSVLFTDPALLFSGGIITPRNSGQLGFNGFNLDSIVQAEIGRFEVMLETQHFEIVTGGVGATGQFRVLINEQFVSLNETAATQVDVAFHYYPVDMGSRQLFKLTVEFEGTALAWIGIDKTGSYWTPRQREPRVLFLGDSLTQSTAATAQALSYCQWLSARMGWEDPWCDGVGGSGYLAPGVGHAFPARATFNYQYKPDIIVIFGGVNDRPVNNPAFTPAALQAAATALYADIVANALPGFNSGVAPKVYVIGCWQPSGTPGSDITAANAAIQAAVATQPTFTFIDTTGWVTGTGHVGATTGVGNGDVVISNDALHPTNEGHQLIGFRAADAILKIFPRIGA